MDGNGGVCAFGGGCDGSTNNKNKTIRNDRWKSKNHGKVSLLLFNHMDLFGGNGIALKCKSST